MCLDCDFCVTDEDGILMCAIRGEQVHGESTCQMWQGVFGYIDGDNFYEVKQWPESQSQSQPS